MASSAILFLNSGPRISPTVLAAGGVVSANPEEEEARGGVVSGNIHETGKKGKR